MKHASLRTRMSFVFGLLIAGVAAFMAVFFPAAEFQVTTRYTEVSGHQFKTEGKVMTNPGWLAVYGKEAASDDDKENAGNLVPPAPDICSCGAAFSVAMQPSPFGPPIFGSVGPHDVVCHVWR